MYDFEKERERHLRHLEHYQRHMNDRLDRQRKRVERSLDQKQARLRQKLGDKQTEIISAALTLLDEQGIADLSLRKLAQLVHVQAPALYWYFKNKSDLTDYLAEAILKPEFDDLKPREDDESWQEWLIDACKRLRKAMLAHRDGVRVVAGAHLYPAVSLVRLFEAATKSLVSAGLSEEHAGLIISTAVHFTFGRVIEEQSMPDPDQYDLAEITAFFEEFPYFQRSVVHSTPTAKASADKFDEALKLIIHD